MKLNFRSKFKRLTALENRSQFRITSSVSTAKPVFDSRAMVMCFAGTRQILAVGDQVSVNGTENNNSPLYSLLLWASNGIPDHQSRFERQGGWWFGFIFKALAREDGRYARLSMAALTRSLVSGLTNRVPFITWETVETETPVSRATSLMLLFCDQLQLDRGVTANTLAF